MSSHQNEVPDLIFTVTDGGVVVNISTASALKVYLRNPVTGVVSTKTGALVTSGTDGKFHYQVLTADISTPGVWQIQGKVEFTTASPWYSDIQEREFKAVLA